MDLWDMTKLLFRRWYFSLPMLLVTLALVAVASVTVKPDYSAKGHIQLIPPVGTTASDGEKNPIKNPWFDLGYEALGNATMIDVNKKSVLERMVADGLTDNVVVTMEEVPLFEIEAVGDSPEQATASVQRVMASISEAVLQRQQTLRVAKTETITTLKLDDGSEVEVKKSKTLRVMIVAAGLGLLLTAGLTIGLDAMLRFRAARRRKDTDPDHGTAVGSAHSDGRGDAATPPPHFDSTQVVPPGRPGGRANGMPEQPAARQSNGAAPQQQQPVARQGNGAAPQQQQPVARQGNGAAPQQRPVRASDGTEYRSMQMPAIDPDNTPVDATIVLPIAPTRWKRDEKADYH